MTKYPILKLTKYQYGILSRRDQLQDSFLENCEIGYKFRINAPDGESLDDKFVGEVVNTEDTIIGRGERFISLHRYVNIYKVEIVEK